MDALQLRIEHQDEFAAHAIRVLEPDRVECAEIFDGAISRQQRGKVKATHP